MHLPDASWRRTMRPQSSTSSQFFGARWLDIDKFGLNTTPIIAICVSKVVLRHLWSWLSGAAQKGHLVVLFWHCHSLYFPNKTVIIFSVCWILLGRQLYGLRDFLALHTLCLAYGDCCMTRTPSNSLRLSGIWRRQSRQFLGYKRKETWWPPKSNSYRFPPGHVSLISL